MYKEKRQIARWICGMICAALLLTMAAWQPAASAATDGMVRVQLTKLSAAKSVSFSTSCAYYINGNASSAIGADSSFTVALEDGSLYLTSGGTKRSMGTSFSLTRSRGGAYGVKAKTPATSNLLCGDLLFSIASSNVRTVLRIYVEDYLYGVVAYEMSNSYPLEALKAQSVAARNYVLRQKSARSGQAYDVTDTTKDQVYRGYVASNARVIQAVNETKGMALYYGSGLAACYYSDSNGGQMESTKNAWGSSLPYSVVKDDPYDLESNGVVKTATINKDATGLKDALREALIKGMAADLKAKGLSAQAADVSLKKIVSITPHSPRFAAPSRLYQKLKFVVEVTGKDRSGASASAQVSADVDTYGALESWYSLGINSANNETVSVEETSTAFKVVFRRWGHGIGLSQQGAKIMANKYGKTAREILEYYYPGTSLKQLSLSDSTGSTSGGNTGTIVVDETPAPEIESIGTAKVSLPNGGKLALRATASASGSVLAELADGALLDVYAVQGKWAAVSYNGKRGFVLTENLVAVSRPGVTPTPPPSAIPSIGYAQVDLGGAEKSMHIRSGASTATASITTVRHGAYLELLGTEGEWSYVRTQKSDVGYIKTKYLILVQQVATPTPTPSATPSPTLAPSPTPGPGLEVYAQVQLESSGSLMNLRAGASTDTAIVTTLQHGAYVKVLSTSGEWCRVQTQNGQTGYVKGKYLRAVQEQPTQEPASTPEPTVAPTPAPTAQGTVYAKLKLSSSSGSMNVRKSASTSSGIVTVLKHGAQVQVLFREGEWCRVRTQGGQTGYVKAKYLVASAEQPTQAPVSTPEPTAAPTPAPTAQELGETTYAKLKLSSSSGSMNVRKSASTSSGIVAVLKHGAQVQVLAREGEWCRIKTQGGQTGYVKTKYLVKASSTQEKPVTTPKPEAQATEKPVSGEVYARVKLASAGGAMNVRKSASTSSAVVTTLKHGAYVRVLAVGSEWSQVQTKDGKTGYIKNKYLVKT